ncbi:MAG: hypothetical protein HUK21_08260, partial [Fibrobacteraceae bacterium]|nr:hypothetical protein [Fibrobacteraceae bacterium]
DKESLITTYYTENGKKKSLLVINKSPYSEYELKLDIPGFKGKAKMQTLDKTSEKLKEGFANDPSKKAKAVDLSKPVKVGKRTVNLIVLE